MAGRDQCKPTCEVSYEFLDTGDMPVITGNQKKLVPTSIAVSKPDDGLDFIRVLPENRALKRCAKRSCRAYFVVDTISPKEVARINNIEYF